MFISMFSHNQDATINAWNITPTNQRPAQGSRDPVQPIRRQSLGSEATCLLCFQCIIIARSHFRWCQHLNTGLWLVNTSHVTWILASDWSHYRWCQHPPMSDHSKKLLHSYVPFSSPHFFSCGVVIAKSRSHLHLCLLYSAHPTHLESIGVRMNVA